VGLSFRHPINAFLSPPIKIIFPDESGCRSLVPNVLEIRSAFFGDETCDWKTTPSLHYAFFKTLKKKRYTMNEINITNYENYLSYNNM
jgi:hypothetical protein